jgi:2-polyprenyl-3-methyl-5-hydroxy-6-metoxy-1,4-benzoquinol methylase
MDKLKFFSSYVFLISEKIIVKLDRLLPGYMRFYETMVNEEIKIGQISGTDAVLHIGSGPIPATAIIISRKTGAKVTGIDVDIHAINNSKKIIENHYQSLNIHILHEHGEKIDAKKFDTIIISDGIQHLNQVLENISNSADTNTQVIFRKTISGNKQFRFHNEFFHNNFQIKKIKTHNSYGELSSIFLIKK